MHPTFRSSMARITILLAALLAACGQQGPTSVTLGAESPAPPTAAEAASAARKDGAQGTGAPTPATGEILLPAEAPPAVEWSTPPACAGEACPRVVIAQAGRVTRADWTEQGLRAAPSAAMPQGSRYVIDTGTPSPDGKWAAFTTLGPETGGPVMLQDTASGSMINLIEEVNRRLPKNQPPLAETFWWDVIGWFPDSARLMLGPGDLSMVMVVNVSGYEAQIIPFEGGGKGGRMFVSLSPDGSQFFFVGEDAQGSQTLSSYSLKDGTVTEIQKMPYSEGIVMQPRFSPDGSSLAFITQKGQPDAGMTWELNLMPAGEAGARTLAKGNLAAAVPAWSPDGQYIAFTRDDARPTLLSPPGGLPAPLRGNLWVVSVADGTETQVTSLDGLARSPAWAQDGETIAFVTHDGQVGMVSLEQPGQVWQAAGASGAYPELTSVFFLP